MAMNHNMFRTMVAGGFAAASLTFAVGVLASPAAAAPVTATSQPNVNAATLAASPQGFIMSDGRICNPRWGC
jgi:hypothetical protein